MSACSWLQDKNQKVSKVPERIVVANTGEETRVEGQTVGLRMEGRDYKMV